MATSDKIRLGMFLFLLISSTIIFIWGEGTEKMIGFVTLVFSLYPLTSIGREQRGTKF